MFFAVPFGLSVHKNPFLEVPRKRLRRVGIPVWIKKGIEEWKLAAGINEGPFAPEGQQRGQDSWRIPDRLGCLEDCGAVSEGDWDRAFRGA